MPNHPTERTCRVFLEALRAADLVITSVMIPLDLSDEFLFDMLLHDCESDGEHDDDDGRRSGDGSTAADLLHLEKLVVGIVRGHGGCGSGPALGEQVHRGEGLRRADSRSQDDDQQLGDDGWQRDHAELLPQTSGIRDSWRRRAIQRGDAATASPRNQTQSYR